MNRLTYFQLSCYPFKRKLPVLYFLLPSLMGHICLSNKPETNRRMIITLQQMLQDRKNFWGWLYRAKSYTCSDWSTYIWSIYVLRNRSLTLFHHCIMGSHFYNSLTYTHLIYHASTRLCEVICSFFIEVHLNTELFLAAKVFLIGTTKVHICGLTGNKCKIQPLQDNYWKLISRGHFKVDLMQIHSGIESCFFKKCTGFTLRFSNCLHAFMNNGNKSEYKCSRKI